MVLIHTLSRVLLLVMSEDILALRAVVPSPDKVSASCAGLSSWFHPCPSTHSCAMSDKGSQAWS